MIAGLIKASERNKAAAAADAARCTEQFINHLGESNRWTEDRPAGEADVYHCTLVGIVRRQYVQQAEGIQLEAVATPLGHRLTKELVEFLVSDVPLPPYEKTGEQIASRRKTSGHSRIDCLSQAVEKSDELGSGEFAPAPQEADNAEAMNPFPDEIPLLD